MVSLARKRMMTDGAGAARSGSWPMHLVALGVAALFLLLLYARDVGDMVGIWWTSSTFEHCLIIPFLIGWLVQQRAGALRRLTPAFWWPGLLVVLAGGVAWLLGAAGSIALFRHLGLVLMLQGTVITTLGRNVAQGLAFPLFYAFFLVPFGEEFVPLLQTVTAKMAMVLLHLAQVPAQIEGVFIWTPNGYFKVAEACSGAKFLIAMAAYAVLVCNVCFLRWGRRILFFMGALLAALLANGVRAFGTIWVAELTSLEFATGFDHVVYGWIFFAIVIALVMAIAWRFFDRKADAPLIDVTALDRPQRQEMPLSGGSALLGAIIALPLLWSLLAGMGSAAVPSRIVPPTIPGWQLSAVDPSYPWEPHFQGADRILHRRYRSPQGEMVDLVIATYASQTEGRELVGFGQGAVDPESDWAWAEPAHVPREGLGERIAAPGPVLRTVASWYAIGDRLTGSAERVKMETLKARLLGGDQRAAAILVSAEETPGHPAGAAIAHFLAAMPPLAELADQSLGRR